MSDPYLSQHREQLLACQRCPQMIGPVVSGLPVKSDVYLIGQAPGNREGEMGKPFAWTAGKTMFRWFESIGVKEDDFRQRAYMAAVCRCFPGKNPKGGDRVPDEDEISRCSQWMAAEIAYLKPKLVIPVGKLAIMQLVKIKKLTEIIGEQRELSLFDHRCDVIALPHPSGASTWHRMSPGKELLQHALELIEMHPAWQGIKGSEAA